MNVMCWNCRSTASKGFTTLIKDMKREYKFSFLLLLETHISGRRATNIVKRFGFDGWFLQEASDQAGGIWCMWDKGKWKVDVLMASRQKSQWGQSGPLVPFNSLW